MAIQEARLCSLEPVYLDNKQFFSTLRKVLQQSASLSSIESVIVPLFPYHAVLSLLHATTVIASLFSSLTCIVVRLFALQISIAC
jgi:hypothetical protein